MLKENVFATFLMCIYIVDLWLIYQVALNEQVWNQCQIVPNLSNRKYPVFPLIVSTLNWIFKNESCQLHLQVYSTLITHINNVYSSQGVIEIIFNGNLIIEAKRISVSTRFSPLKLTYPKRVRNYYRDRHSQICCLTGMGIERPRSHG